jgi:quercetin dioxygenase-like cupin family protein
MFISNINVVAKTAVAMAGVSGVTKQSLVGPEQGWEGHVMRLFTLAEGGYTPRHNHGWPHINYIVSGSGTLHMNGTDHPVTAGSVAFVPPGTEHQFRNTGSEDFAFICIVPEEGDK